ncbi:MAG: hypothetical protein M3161_07215 [Actinomycetota bacterium]|nr:hypothetical protein [Actinomycetota bacterium]
MLGRALDATFRNFSTLFLLGAIFFVPLHLGHAFVFRNALAVQELRPEIERFPPNKNVRGVGPVELNRERMTLLLLGGIDVLVAVGLFGAARRVHEMHDAGEVPTVGDALRGSASYLSARPDIAVTLGGIAVGAVAAFLVYRIGSIATELLGAPATFVGVGMTRAVAASAFFAVALGCAAASARPSQRGVAKLDVY